MLRKKVKIRYQLMRPSVDGDYKKPGAVPKTKVVKGEDGKEKQIQDMEIICTDYPLNMPVILYNQNEAHEVVSGKPMIVYKGDLYGIYNFIQLPKKNGEIVINIFVLYAGDSKLSTLTKR